MEARNILPATW